MRLPHLEVPCKLVLVLAVVVMAGCNGSENSNQSDTSSSSEIDSPSLHSLEESNGDMAQTIVTSFSESPDKLDTATEVRVRLNTKTTINNNAPEITSTAIDTVNENDSYSYTVITNDVDEGDKVSLTVTFNDPSAENWLHFNPANGVLFGTPSNNDVGAYDVAITATDDSKATDTQSFTITVVDVNHAPTAQDQMFMVSSRWVDNVLDSTDFSFNDVDGDPIKEIKITEPSNGAIFSQQGKKNEYPLTVPVSELPSLKFKLVTTNLDDSQVFYVEFEFQVSDGELYSETQTMKIVDLKSAVDECLKDSSNGDCRIFLDNSQNLSEWDTSKVTDMTEMFMDAVEFNADIGGWDTGNVTKMIGMFSGATAFNQNIGDWVTDKVTDMGFMFANATAFDQDIGEWVTDDVTKMVGMFDGATAFNQNIGKWVTDEVTDMGFMFSRATTFNQNIGQWKMPKVENVKFMFSGATAFNQDIGQWKMPKVENVTFMFSEATAFNQDIGEWELPLVTDMSFMFSKATAFDQNIGEWEIPLVTDMSSMFSGATAFNQDIDRWDISAETSVCNMFFLANALETIPSWYKDSHCSE